MTRLVLLLIFSPLLVGLVVMCLRSPMKVALPAYAILMPFGGLLSVGTSRFGSPSSLIGVVLGVGLVGQLLATRTRGVRISATIPLWLLFLAAAAATELWSLSPGQTATGFLVLSSLVLVYVLVGLNNADRTVLTRTENGLLIGGMLVTCYGFMQLLFLGGFPQDSTVAVSHQLGRFGNDMLGPNNEAVALLLPLLVALSRSLTLPDRSKRVLHGFVALVLFIGILMTGSRGGILATLVAVIVLAMANPQGRRTLVKGLVAGIALVAVAWIYHPAGIATRDVATTSSSGRTDIWRVGFAACPHYCVFGSGWETFPDVYAATQASVPNAAVLVGGGNYQPHNVWLLVAIELGLPGLVLLASVLIVTFYEALRLPAAMRGPPMSGFIATIVAALFLSNLEYKFFWMALIMVALSRNVALAESRPPAGRLGASPQTSSPGIGGGPVSVPAGV
jgi:O-antigen ligase